ncbi:right-handed parallel beta-helix repeat-containing protein [Amycolatopsis sp. CA-126428]|uniref:right-handed parallel beta-helix repeat-containing protein n=1 Tax=Amycolatopsis sp. CA-126428 TaxID=2073158 RepID=UPI001304A89E|nr:right-handed parallel beta-helix repeat-containing protein [Amycolatopsis sp. CA-126428]
MKPAMLLRLAAVVGFTAASAGTFLTGGTANAATTTYFVSPAGSDSNPGTSSARPFKTIQKAADATAPGDVVQLMSGTYQETATGRDVVNITRSGAPGAPITYEAFPGAKPVIHPVTGWNGIRITGASHIRISGLEVAGNALALDLAEARSQAGRRTPVFNTNCIGAYKDEKTGQPAHDLDISGNDVHHCPGGGISAIDADRVTINGNRVHSTSWYTEYATSGISILRATDVGTGDPAQYKIRITGNTVYDNETKVIWTRIGKYSDGNGIIIDTLKDKEGMGADYQGRVLVSGNVSFDNGGSGIHSFKSQHVDIANNTAYHNGRSPNMDPYANIFAAYSADVRIFNNIVVASPGKPVNSNGKNTDVSYDYNIYFGGNAPVATGAHDLVADPKLSRPGTDSATANFGLVKGSPAIDSGSTSQLAAIEAAGRRHAGPAPDRGAQEFAPAGTTAAVSTPAEAGGAAEKPSPSEAATSAAGAPAEPAEVAAAGNAGPAGLPRTGIDTLPLLAGGTALLAAGVVTVVLVRRRRTGTS